MAIKEKLTEAAERVYDLVKEGKYNVELDLKELKDKKGLKIKTQRKTAHNKKWRSKNR